MFEEIRVLLHVSKALDQLLEEKRDESICNDVNAIYEGVTNAEGDGTLPPIPGGLKIPCYLTLHGKKLVVRARDIIGENKTE